MCVYSKAAGDHEVGWALDGSDDDGGNLPWKEMDGVALAATKTRTCLSTTKRTKRKMKTCPPQRMARCPTERSATSSQL